MITLTGNEALGAVQLGILTIDEARGLFGFGPKEVEVKAEEETK
jgi:hypothetical protein